MTLHTCVGTVELWAGWGGKARAGEPSELKMEGKGSLAKSTCCNFHLLNGGESWVF